MGINVATVFSEFGGKQGLYVQALEKYEAQKVPLFIGALERPGANLQTVLQVLRDFARFAESGTGAGCLITNSAIEFAPDPDRSQDALTPLSRAIAERLCARSQRVSDDEHPFDARAPGRAAPKPVARGVHDRSLRHDSCQGCARDSARRGRGNHFHPAVSPSRGICRRGHNCRTPPPDRPRNHRGDERHLKGPLAMSTSTRTITTRTDTRLVEVTVTDTVAASPEVIWSILSDDFLHVSTWARGVNTSVANPKTPTGINGSPHGGRVCEVDGLGITDERITAYDAAQHTLSYSVAAQKKPFFVEALGSTWSVQPGADANSAVVTLTTEAHTKGLLGGVGRTPLRTMLQKAAPALLRDLTVRAEK